MAVKRLGASATGISIEGLPELSRALKSIGPELQRELKRANKDVARFVADDARGAASGLGSTAAKAAPSVKPTAGAGYAGVALGGAGYPFAAGAEFGGQRRPTTMQFEPWRGSGEGAGYFLYPTIRRDAERIEDEYGSALDEVIRKAGLAP